MKVRLLKIKLLKQLMAIAIGSAILASCSSNSSSLSQPGSRQSKDTLNSKSTHRPSTKIPAISESSLASSLFVATSAEYNNPHFQNQWSSFITSMENKMVASCLENYGFTTQETAFIANLQLKGNSTDNVDYPDVARLRQGDLGLGGPATTAQIPKSNIPANEEKAWGVDLRKCFNVKLPGLNGIVAQLDPIRAIWNNDLTSVWINNSVTTALRTWTTCVAGSGMANMPSTQLGLRDFFGKIDDLMMTHTNLTYNSPQIVGLVKIYGKCIAPVATAMDNVRSHDRHMLLAQYASQLNVIAQEMSKEISIDTAKYGLNI